MQNKGYLYRLYVVVFFALSFSVILVYKFFSVQIINVDYYRTKARNQHERIIKLEPKRGIIYDRNGKQLAINLRANSYGVDFSKISKAKRKKIAWSFSTITSETYDHLYQRIRRAKGVRWVARKVQKKHKARVDGWKIPGIFLVESTNRSYPYGSLAAHVLGFTNIDNKGLEGLELSLNNRMQGVDGKTILQIDAHGNLQPNFRNPDQKAIDGNNIELTIDVVYQKIIEEELKQTVDRYQARGGCVILMNPQTGEILAQANYPTFNPNKIALSARSARRNRIVTDMYEPGSTFKMVPLAAALEENVAQANDRINCENGAWRCHTTIIHDSHKYKSLSFAEVISHSSNIGTAKIAAKLGERKLYEYARSFGFGAKTGVALPGEVSGVLRNPSRWSKLSLTMVSFGQEMSATPLQVINAYAAIANGGELMRPLIIKRITNSKGEVIKEYHPEIIRRVVSRKNARAAADILGLVVTDGTAVKAAIEGINIAGKTGTAQKSLPGKGYQTGLYVSSFAGFLPIEDPRLACLVMIDEPKTAYYASEVAVPAFRRIIERIIETPHSGGRDFFYKTVPIPVAPEVKMASVPTVRMFPVAKAVAKLKRSGFVVHVAGSGDTVLMQFPQAGMLLTTGGEVKIMTKTHSTTKKAMPILTGLSLRLACSELSALSVSFVVKGSGVVISQLPAAGSVLAEGEKCILKCGPAI